MPQKRGECEGVQSVRLHSDRREFLRLESRAPMKGAPSPRRGAAGPLDTAASPVRSQWGAPSECAQFKPVPDLAESCWYARERHGLRCQATALQRALGIELEPPRVAAKSSGYKSAVDIFELSQTAESLVGAARCRLACRVVWEPEVNRARRPDCPGACPLTPRSRWSIIPKGPTCRNDIQRCKYE